jgi:hypothetical protein
MKEMAGSRFTDPIEPMDLANMRQNDVRSLAVQYHGCLHEVIMNRRNIFTLSAITALGLALLPGSAVAQQGTLKQQLVGSWTLVSDETTAPNGRKQLPWGANPKGILIFDAGGRFANVFGKPDRPKLKSGPRAGVNRPEVTAQEFGAAALEFGANYGTWSINEADKTLTRRLEGALDPNNEGIEGKSTVSLAGDELKLTTTNPAGIRDIVYRRAR